MNTVIRSIALANPPRYATQKAVYDFFVSNLKLDPAEHDLYKKVLTDGPIRGRYIAVDYDDQALQLSPDQQISRFLSFGKSISVQASRQALADAQLAQSDIGGIVVNTCTGYLCPGLSSYIAQDLKLPSSIRVLDIMGMGCGAAIPNLQSAAGLAIMTQKPILAIAVEICSATMFFGPDPGLVISNSIFGDGAAAVIIDIPRGPGEKAPSLLELEDFGSVILPQYRDQLRYRTENGRLRNVLSPRVPVIGARCVSQVTESILNKNSLTPADIDFWAVHPGGTAVLEQVASTLSLTPGQLKYSFRIFQEFGNMSSPSVLFVLKQIINESKPTPGQKALLLSFGAGFTAFASLAKFL